MEEEEEGEEEVKAGVGGGTAMRCVAEMDVSKWPFCRHKKGTVRPPLPASTSHHVERPLKRQHESLPSPPSSLPRTAVKTATGGAEEEASFNCEAEQKNL